MKAFLFPGQGSQYKGMGADVFAEFPELTAQADEILGYSIQSLCVNDTSNQLNQTQYTQPALYVVNALTYFKHLITGGSQPDYVAGHSLGEYNALLAAGAFDFTTGLKLVKTRGELMSQAQGGGMAAVMNGDEALIKKLLVEQRLAGIDIANYNSPTQLVISGPTEELAALNSALTNAGCVFIPLRVSAAFHSRYMKNAAKQYGRFLQNFIFNNVQIPVIANINASPYLGHEIAKNLQHQMDHSVQWVASIQYLLQQGVAEFIEIGPGKVLTKLVNAIQSNTPTVTPKQLKAENLGSATFKKKYNIRYAYLAGAMVKGIASKELVVSLANAGLMGFYGTGGMRLDKIEEAIQFIQREARANTIYGMNLLSNLANPDIEMATVDLFLKYDIRNVEAAAYIQLSLALVKYRLTGLTKNADGKIVAKHCILAKVSRPEVADIFLNPPPLKLVEQLVKIGAITDLQAALSQQIAMADELCVEADSGGHTDMGNMAVLLPTIMRQRDVVCTQRQYPEKIAVGAAGGIGTPEAAAAAFVLGAEFIMTGSINQCTVEAGTSDIVKDMLAQLNVQDTDYAPAGDMFEYGSKIQVMRKGVFFPARANKLFELWQRHQSWEEIDTKTREQIESRYFGRTFDDVYQETKSYYLQTKPQEIDKAESNAKHKLALVFRWYFIHSARLARSGDTTDKVNYQVYTGPAMGAFNQWVRGTELENWRHRGVAKIADLLMQATADLLTDRLNALGLVSQ